MADTWTDRWDERYSKSEFAYGEQPNNYLKEQLEKLKPKKYFFLQKEKGVMLYLLQNLAGQFLHLILVMKAGKKHWNFRQGKM